MDNSSSQGAAQGINPAANTRDGTDNTHKSFNTQAVNAGTPKTRAARLSDEVYTVFLFLNLKLTTCAACTKVNQTGIHHSVANTPRTSTQLKSTLFSLTIAK